MASRWRITVINNAILEFIRRATRPERVIKDPNRFEPLRTRLNQALAVAGLVVTESGSLESADRVETRSEARRRAQQLRAEKGEQRGFANLVKGIFGMFRNPTAHEPRIYWSMTREDAEDLLSLVSLIHTRLDSACMPPRI